MKTKFLILSLLAWSIGFGQSVPNTTTFNLWNVLDAVSGTHASGNLSDAFTNSVETKFDAAYGSKTMSPKTLLGFRNYGYVAPPTGYGYLYNFWALANIAATGWHVPSDAEWHTLALYLDSTSTNPLQGNESTIAGAYMKETGTTHWTTPNTGATNSSGFTGLPEGARNEHGVFYNRGLTTTWASSTAYGTGDIAYFYRSLGYDNTVIYRNYAYKQYGFSVRLLKNDSTDPGTYTGNDGATYTTVKIGNQVWLATNLIETKDNTGTYIPVVAGSTEWEALTSAALCTYIP